MTTGGEWGIGFAADAAAPTLTLVISLSGWLGPSQREPGSPRLPLWARWPLPAGSVPSSDHPDPHGSRREGWTPRPVWMRLLKAKQNQTPSLPGRGLFSRDQPLHAQQVRSGRSSDLKPGGGRLMGEAAVSAPCLLPVSSGPPRGPPPATSRQPGPSCASQEQRTLP